MTYETFCTNVQERVQEIKGEEVSVSIVRSLKNNGRERMSLIIKGKEDEVVPSLFLEEFYSQYECGISFEDILEKILAVYDEYEWEGEPDFSFFSDFESARSHIAYKLISQNENQELLGKVPWFPVLDLAMVFYCILPKQFKVKASILIDNSHMALWQVNKEEVYEAAYLNTPKLLPFGIEPIQSVLEQLLKQPDEKFEEGLKKEMEENVADLAGNIAGMYVLSNNEQFFGAACILYPEVLHKFAEKNGENIFILPSSVHEVLLIPDDGSFSAEEFAGLVREVNMTQVEPEERLSDCVYYYRMNSGRITIASGKNGAT